MTSEHIIWLMIGVAVGYLLFSEAKKPARPKNSGPAGGKPGIITGENLPSVSGGIGCGHCGGVAR